jgi:hypothetical protein
MDSRYPSLALRVNAYSGFGILDLDRMMPCLADSSLYSNPVEKLLRGCQIGDSYK